MLRLKDSIIDQNIKVNQQLWLDYNFKNNIDSLKVLNTQIGFRKISPNVFNRFFLLSHFNLPQKKFGYFKSRKTLYRVVYVGSRNYLNPKL